MALAGAVTQLGLYGGVGLPYPPLESAVVETPTIVSGGSGGRARRDRTRYGWVQPRFRRDEEPEPEAEPSPNTPKRDTASAPPPSTPTAEPEILATPPDPAEEELLLQLGVMLLGMLDE